MVSVNRGPASAGWAQPALDIAFFGSSLVSTYWNEIAVYYRGIIRQLHKRGHRVTFYEPDIHDRQRYRDIPDPAWAHSVVYSAENETDVYRCLEAAQSANLVIKAGNVGVFDELLEAAVLDLRRADTQVAFWDVAAPATLARVHSDPADPLRSHIPRYDLILTNSGPAAVRAYQALGAQQCISVYSALDPDTHYPAPRDPRFVAALGFLGDRRPGEERRVGELFLKPAYTLSEQHFLLGGSGWRDKPMPGNVIYLSHVFAEDHNAFNCSPLALLHVAPEGTAAFGYAPPAHLFAAAGAGACIITDAGEGLERFLEPGQEVLVAHSGDDVIDYLSTLTVTHAAQIGSAARRHVLAAHTYAHRVAQLERLLFGRHVTL